MAEIDIDQTETVQENNSEDMMDSWTNEKVARFVMGNGYWFIICASIESAWQDCENLNMANELDHYNH